MKGKEQVEYFEESIENDRQMPSDSPQVEVEVLKVPIKALVHPVPFPQMLKNIQLEK